MRPTGKGPLPLRECDFNAIGQKALPFYHDPSERKEYNYLIICSLYPKTIFIILKTLNQEQIVYYQLKKPTALAQAQNQPGKGIESRPVTMLSPRRGHERNRPQHLMLRFAQQFKSDQALSCLLLITFLYVHLFIFMNEDLELREIDVTCLSATGRKSNALWMQISVVTHCVTHCSFREPWKLCFLPKAHFHKKLSNIICQLHN